MRTTQPPRQIRGEPQPAARRRPGKKAKTAKRTEGYAPHDFLKQSFLPVSHFYGYRKDKTTLLEQQFFTSLENLCERFGLMPDNHQSNPFPHNILAALHDVEKKLKLAVADLELLITENEGVITLATVQELGIDYTLCYVPINALDWLHAKSNKQTYLLLASLFAYLHQLIGMPVMSDFLTDCYDAVENWVENDNDELDDEDLKLKKATLTEMRRKSKILEGVVRDQAHLHEFASRVFAFQAQNETEHELHEIAKEIYQLYQDFPSNNFYQQIESGYSEYPDDDRGYPDQYFSFFWDDNGWLEEDVMHYVNSYLQEVCTFDQPVAIEYFNIKVVGNRPSLDFEKRLLNLIGQLSTTTYKLI
jgi:hypothetical protein